MRQPLQLCFFLVLSVSLAAQTSTVPFIGCPSNGQGGPVAAPQGPAHRVAVSPDAAARLAWFEARDAPGVLAPRQWHCFGTYGSSGATLYVSSKAVNAQLVLSEEWTGFPGPAIEISRMDGGTSGRIDVAQKVARLFPAHMDFVRQVIAEGIEPASEFPRGPYPDDRLIYRTQTLVDFETPGHRKGLGTASRLEPNGQPIRGFVSLSFRPNEDPYDISLEMRLPSNLTTLASPIQAATEHSLEKVP